MTTVADALSIVPLFKGMPAAELSALAARMSQRTFQAGTTIFARNDSGDSMYVLLSGRVQLYLPPNRETDAATVLAELESGDFFGEMALLDDEPRSASAQALDDVVLGELDRGNFLQHLQSSGTAAFSIINEISRRLRLTTRLLSHQAALDVDKEVETHLSFAERFADRMALWNGSWLFVALLLGLTGVWMTVNHIMAAPFDAYPYQFYNLFLAVLVALQGPLIMMSQNRQATKDRLRSETDFRVNLKNEVGIEQVLRELAKLRLELNQMGEKRG